MIKKEMTAWLRGHFRHEGGIAINVKIRNLGFPKAIEDNAYALLDCREPFEVIEEYLEYYNRGHNHRYQIGWGGRSGGYLVLMTGGYRERLWADKDMKPGMRSYSDLVGRWFTYDEAKRNGWIGKVYHQPYTSGVYGAEVTDKTGVPELRDMMKIVKDFDATVKKAVGIFRTFAEKYKVVDVTYMVPQTVKRCVKKSKKEK